MHTVTFDTILTFPRAKGYELNSKKNVEENGLRQEEREKIVR